MNDTYLGDGVYAHFDGFCVWLDLRAQVEAGHICKIALEPGVLQALDLFREDCYEGNDDHPQVNPKEGA